MWYLVADKLVPSRRRWNVNTPRAVIAREIKMHRSLLRLRLMTSLTSVMFHKCNLPIFDHLSGNTKFDQSSCPEWQLCKQAGRWRQKQSGHTRLKFPHRSFVTPPIWIASFLVYSVYLIGTSTFCYEVLEMLKCVIYKNCLNEKKKRKEFY